jgi:hypothetical protein
MLRDLDGVKRKQVKGKFVGQSVSAFMTALKKDKYLISAGDDGSITVWVRDDGRYGYSFDRFMVSQSCGAVKTKKELRTWLSIYVPKMGR